MSDSFELHAQLAADCEILGDLALCRALLMRDARFPWLILVPRLPGLRDFHELPREHRDALLDEIERASIAVRDYGRATKINVAALGNMVPQLHVHVIGRREDDAGWPGPVWNAGPAEPLEDEPLRERVAALKQALF